MSGQHSAEGHGQQYTGSSAALDCSCLVSKRRLYIESLKQASERSRIPSLESPALFNTATPEHCNVRNNTGMILFVAPRTVRIADTVTTTAATSNNNQIYSSQESRSAARVEGNPERAPSPVQKPSTLSLFMGSAGMSEHPRTVKVLPTQAVLEGSTPDPGFEFGIPRSHVNLSGLSPCR